MWPGVGVVLGIETSCDETGVGLVADGVLLGQALASSMDEHARFGGVVPEIASRAHLRNLLPVIFHDDWDAEKGAWDVDADDVPTLARGVERFDKSIRTVNQDVETGLVNLTVDWIDPVLARDWAQGLIAEVNADMRGRAIDQSKRNIEFLKGQLEATDAVELRTAVFSVMESEMKNAMMAAVRTDFAFEVIDPPVVPEKPAWPNRILLAVVGFFLGGMIGVLTVLMRRPKARTA